MVKEEEFEWSERWDIRDGNINLLYKEPSTLQKQIQYFCIFTAKKVE